MSDVLWLGILFGVGAALSVGPVFVTIIEESLTRGFKSGFQVILGSAFADCIMLIPALFAGWLIAEIESLSFYISLAGVLFFVYLSINAMRDSFLLWKRTNPIAYNKPRWSFWKGMIGNLINPATWTFWIATGIPTILYAHKVSGKIGLIVFVATWFVSSSGLESVLSFSIAKAKYQINSKSQSIFTFVSSLMFLGLAILILQGIRASS